MLAQGGLVLATSYAFFTITVALLLIRGLRKLDGSPRLLLGGVGGAWVAYVVQSIVSIDQVPLLTIQFVAGSAVVGLVGVAAWERRLPGARPISPTRPGRARPREPLKRRDLSGADGAGLAATLAIGLVLAWLALLPLRANAAIHAGDVAVGRGDGTSGLSDYQRANQLLLGSGIYWGKTGELLENVGQPKKAYAVYRRGLLHDPFDLFLIRKAAALADAQHEDSVARTMNRRAVALDPSNPETVLQAAAWATAHGEPKWGLGVLAGPLAIFPDNADMWAAVGDAQRALGAQAQANRAYSRALLLNPQQAAAKAGLAMLTASGPAS
jgi:tetratricopeptide (TPR) repeat protein